MRRRGGSRAVQGLDRLSITLVKPSAHFLQRLAMPFFCPVPTDTPPAPRPARTGWPHDAGSRVRHRSRGRDRIARRRSCVGLRTPPAFAERWTDVGSVLDAGAWAAATPVAYVPDRWSAYLFLSPDCCSEPGRPDASLVEPVLGPLDVFGRVVQTESPIIRCGVLDASARQTLAGILRRAGADIGDGEDRAEATLNFGTGLMSLIVVPLLPDDREGCSLE